ncbi:MAG: hypothetical protein V4687_13715 [Bacteroidota bacterium]
MSNKTGWKEHLLKSGIPLEFEIKKYLTTKGCISNFEYTYLRNNESDLPTEFSYDIDSSYIKGHHFVDLMIECKYRHESTKWVFLPEEYGSPDEIEFTSFMHKNSHFSTARQVRYDHPIAFARLCSKGIELTSEGPNPKTITQAINQLSYAMAERIVNGMHHQLDVVLGEQFGGTNFYNIPIIITTAELYRIKEESDIETIKGAQNIEDISDKAPFLIIKNKPGIDLETYNNQIFQAFIDEYGKEKLEKHLFSFNKDVDFVMSVMAKEYCPRAIAVIHYSKEENGLEQFFTYIDRVFNPDEEIIALIKQKSDELKAMLQKFQTHQKA